MRQEETEDFTSPERACIQAMIWRTRQPQHEVAVHGLTRRFFCHFLHRWSIIITDSAQTNASKVMWEGMVAWALRDPEHYVYVWDGTGESGCLHSPVQLAGVLRPPGRLLLGRRARKPPETTGCHQHAP